MTIFVSSRPYLYGAPRKHRSRESRNFFRFFGLPSNGSGNGNLVSWSFKSHHLQAQGQVSSKISSSWAHFLPFSYWVMRWLSSPPSSSSLSLSFDILISMFSVMYVDSDLALLLVISCRSWLTFCFSSTSSLLTAIIEEPEARISGCYVCCSVYCSDITNKGII